MSWFSRGMAVVGAMVVVLLAVLWATSVTGPLAGLRYPLDYEETTVTVEDANGTTLATVDVRVAENARELYIGLSETDTLADGEGMLFVHGSAGEQTYVMRGMAFPLDIVFVDGNGTITTVHHAPVPEDTPESELRRYRGQATYVLEVPRGYTNATGIDVGDYVTVPDGVSG